MAGTTPAQPGGAVKVGLLTVGTELLLGDVVNGNAAWLGEQLAEVGIGVSAGMVVSDDPDEIADAVVVLLERSDAVVACGGIGPTRDDATRDALARVSGAGLRRDERVEQRLQRRYSELGVPLREPSLRQAELPAGAEPLPNPAGTAEGVRMELPGWPGKVAYALPGVPAEMRAMFTASVRPELLELAGEPAVTVSRSLHTAVVWESVVAHRLRGLDEELAGVGNPMLAYLASPAQVRVRITARAGTRDDAMALVAPVERRARDLLGETVYGTDGETLDEVVHGLLAGRGATVAVAESLTGGLLGGALTAMAGSSRTFRGGVSAYATELKSALLGVDADLLAARGTVDPEVAIAMAAGVRQRLGSTYGLAVTGVAGPEPQGDRPPGTVHLATVGPDDVRRTDSRCNAGTRPHVRELTVVHALDLLRRTLLGHPAFYDWEDKK